MKNKFLLLGATALLSAGALMANAGTVPLDPSTKKAQGNFVAKVSVILPVSMNISNSLSFGNVIDPKSSETITINAGKISGDATLLGYGKLTSSPQNIIPGNDTSQPVMSFAGLERVLAPLGRDHANIKFPDGPVELTSTSGTCGTINFITEADGFVHVSQDGVNYPINATLSLQSTEAEYCSANITATLMLDD